MIVGEIELSEVEHKNAPLWRHKQGISYTASGYGRRIPSPTMVRWQGRWRRVYVCIFSNVGMAYIERGKDCIVVRG